MRVILGVSGGIAAYKAVLLLRLLTEAGHSVRVIPTESALRFVGTPTWEALSGQPVSTTVFDEVPGATVYVGSVIVTGAGLYVIWRERQLGLTRKREVESPPAQV